MLIDSDIAFLFVGGAHQAPHLAPVAAKLSAARADLVVHCICADAETFAALMDIRRTMGADRLRVTRIAKPLVASVAETVTRRHSAGKIPLLASLAWRLRRARAIVVPERTSAALRHLGWRRPLIHFRHGAGDRAPKSEKRLKAFDLIVVPGEKDRARAVAAQGIDPTRLCVSGYVKLDYLTGHDGMRPTGALFADDRPIVVYNPHFDPALSSWAMARAVIARFAAQDRYNLVFAPHIRISRDLGDDEIAAWRSLAQPGRIIVDLDSPRLIDMTYMREAALYLGDVSSQLYEFLIRPRPAVFLNAHDVSWRDDPRYAGWHLGAVASDPDDVLPAIDRAIAGHPAVRAQQEAAVCVALGDYQGACDRGARAIIDFLDGRDRPTG